MNQYSGPCSSTNKINNKRSLDEFTDPAPSNSYSTHLSKQQKTHDQHTSEYTDLERTPPPTKTEADDTFLSFLEFD